MTDVPNEQDVNALAIIIRHAGMGWPRVPWCRAFARAILASEWYAAHEAQIRDLLEEREELFAVIRRLRMGNHPAGRALRAAPPPYHDVPSALQAALAERDAEHEGGAS